MVSPCEAMSSTDNSINSGEGFGVCVGSLRKISTPSGKTDKSKDAPDEILTKLSRLFQNAEIPIVVTLSGISSVDCHDAPHSIEVTLSEITRLVG